MYTKRNIVEMAFGELALASYVFDLSPEEQQAALNKLDTQMASLVAQDIDLGYAFGVGPQDSNLDDDSGIALHGIEYVYLRLSLSIAASKGKVMPQSTKVALKNAFDELMVVVAHEQLRQQQFPGGTPAGAGNKPWRQSITRPFLCPPQTGGLSGQGDGNIDFGS